MGDRRGRTTRSRFLALALVATLSACGANGASSATKANADAPPTTAATTTILGDEVTGTSAPAAAVGLLPPDFRPITGPIVPLSFNDDVKRLQARLNELKFWVGEDGPGEKERAGAY